MKSKVVVLTQEQFLELSEGAADWEEVAVEITYLLCGVEVHNPQEARQRARAELDTWMGRLSLDASRWREIENHAAAPESIRQIAHERSTHIDAEVEAVQERFQKPLGSGKLT